MVETKGDTDSKRTTEEQTQMIQLTTKRHCNGRSDGSAKTHEAALARSRIPNNRVLWRGRFKQ